jgi:hypothetical protein
MTRPKVSALCCSSSSSSSSASFMLSMFCLAMMITIGTSNIPTGAKAALAEEKGNDAVGSFTSIENDFKYDENNKLASYYIVFPANRPDCTYTANLHGTSPHTGFAAVALEGDALGRVFPDYNTDGTDERCMAACLEKGTDISVAGYTMPNFHFEVPRPPSTRKDYQRFEQWYSQSCRRVEVCLINYVSHESPLQVYWIEPSQSGLPRDDDLSKKREQASLQFGERKTNCFHSFIGHEFEAYIIDKNDETGEEGVSYYERFAIEHTTTKAFGTSPPSSSRTFENENDLEVEVKRALDTEWSKHSMVERSFSSLGFSKGRLPDDVFASMGSFYYNNRNNVVNEEWQGKGLFVNWWETDVKFIAMPWSLKQKWQLRLSELVSAWSGVEVEETSMYGMRQYETGARLLSHVDRLPTHAVSLIVNVAQENLANPWPVEVFDHADRLHEINMIPGDIVYYESAKNLHGRNRPLTCKDGGCRFVNLFTHYRPKADGGRWHTNLDDMPNRPAPLLQGEVDSDQDETICTLSSDDNNDGGDIGVGTVDCNDSRLGSYVSPTLFKATSGVDLYRWWKATADPNFIGFGHSKKLHDSDGVEDTSGTPSTATTNDGASNDEL